MSILEDWAGKSIQIWHIGSIHAGQPADLAEILSPLSPAGNMPSFAAAGSIRCFPGPPRSLADIACMHARSLCDAVPSLMIRASRPAGRHCRQQRAQRLSPALDRLSPPCARFPIRASIFKPQLAEEEDEEGRGGEEG
uniref:Uncharacterized protein n=1 Tax=Oryza glumipatula TaxID=40148 RepID=A0A0D9Y5A9_9ORYZ